MARAARVMVTTMRALGNKEGKGGKGHGIGNKGGVRHKGRWRQRQEQWREGWWASECNEGNGDGDGNGYGYGTSANVGDGDGNEAAG